MPDRLITTREKEKENEKDRERDNRGTDEKVKSIDRLFIFISCVLMFF